jgi:hypothetical protein
MFYMGDHLILSTAVVNISLNTISICDILVFNSGQKKFSGPSLSGIG